MNKRLVELHNQTMNWVADNGSLRISDRIPAGYTEKFAELIVRECLNIVKNADMIDLEGPDPEDVLYVACKQLKEHFGLDTNTD